MAKIESRKSQAEPGPEVGIRWSKKLIAATGAISLVVTITGVSGFFIYEQFQKQPIADSPVQASAKTATSKNYSNDYWGFRFQYPASWYPVIGSYDEGDYFFASEPINFIKELSPGQALLEVRTYNNFKNLSFDAWLKDQEQNYFPLGTPVVTDKKAYSIKRYRAVRYHYSLKKTINNINFWDVVVVSKDDKNMYIIMLETGDLATQNHFEADFNSIIGSVDFYTGFGG